MSKFLKGLALAGALAGSLTIVSGAAVAETYGLGRAATPDEIKAWDIDIRPDGMGLPEGKGDVAMGETVFIERCASCHGDFGEGSGRWPVLTGGTGSLATEDPVKTIGSYWPYLSTVWDYIHRAMPFGDAQSLTNDEVYAITAYLLNMNDIVDDDFELSKANFLDVKMPNANGFFMDDREETAVWKQRNPCMKDCKAEVKITGYARVIDVTPEETKAKEEAADAAKAAEEEAKAPANPIAAVTGAVSSLAGAATQAASKAASAATNVASQAASQVAAAVAPAPDPALVEAGEKVFKKCKACHEVGDGAKHKQGPHLNGVFGRTAGTSDGFKKYSKAMKKAGEDGLVWSDETMAQFLKKPKAMLKKTKMAFSGLKKEKDLDAIIAYLKSH